MAINEDILKGKWKQFKGEIRSRWGKLTDDELDEIEGNRIKLEGKLQERYGYTREQAREEVDRWLSEH